jgi:acyl-coenzyme A thioesterase PaaI-like protein
MSGLEVFQAMRDGKLPHPSMADTIPMRVTEASPGYVKFSARADRRHVNPLGGVHGGFAATVLDSVTGCAVHTLLSFGGTVALAYATRHPAHPAKVILVSTEAAGDTHLDRRVALFERLGGPEVGALARRRFVESQGHTDVASVEAWLRLAFPLYTRTPRDPPSGGHAVVHAAGRRGHTFNLFPDLSRVRCPTLLLGGEDDPMTPIECQADIAAALPAHLVRFERFAGCGHAVLPDALERALAVIRDFVTR